MKECGGYLTSELDYDFEMIISTEFSEYKETLATVDINFFDYFEINDEIEKRYFIKLTGYIFNEHNSEDLLWSADSVSGDILYKAQNFFKRVDEDDFWGSTIILEYTRISEEFNSFEEKSILCQDILTILAKRLEAFGVNFLIFFISDILENLVDDEKRRFVNLLIKRGFIPIVEEFGEIVMMRDLRYV